MINGAAHSDIIGVVELADADNLYQAHGEAIFGTLRDEVAKRLCNWIRPEDDWTPMDDNRYCVVLKNITGRGQLELAAAKLTRLFEQPYEGLGRNIPLQVTAGFASMDAGTVDQEQAMRRANLALRSARRTARQYDIYSPEEEANLSATRDLLRDLEAAVEKGELELYYQPKVHAGFRSITGAEALMRWHSREKGVVPPDEFIPVAEQHDVIRPMTWWAIKSVIARLARWENNLSIAVNITPTLLLDDEIYWVVKDALEIYDIDPARLTLEVTEGVMVENQYSMLEQLARLRELGLKVAIDDFGTGFSSLAYFRDLPADEIKIDKSFVLHMRESERDRAIVKAVIDLAHNFNLRVVAEGVEDEWTARRLADLQCDYLQGYLVDRPLMLEDFEKRYISKH